MTREHIVLLGCGDVGPVHEPMETYSTLVRPTLATGDIRFAQCERLYSERNVGSDKASVDLTLGHRALKPHLISIFTDCGFNVVSLAGNHTMEWGGMSCWIRLHSLRKRASRS